MYLLFIPELLHILQLEILKMLMEPVVSYLLSNCVFMTIPDEKRERNPLKWIKNSDFCGRNVLLCGFERERGTITWCENCLLYGDATSEISGHSWAWKLDGC